MDISIIIPTYGRTRYLKDTLLSISSQSIDEEYEVLVVDNNLKSDRKIYSIVKELNQSADIPIRYVPEPRVGLLYARHRGAKESRGQILVYVDDDVLCPAG